MKNGTALEGGAGFAGAGIGVQNTKLKTQKPNPTDVFGILCFGFCAFALSVQHLVLVTKVSTASADFFSGDFPITTFLFAW
jgi:hypothetical protein